MPSFSLNVPALGPPNPAAKTKAWAGPKKGCRNTGGVFSSILGPTPAAWVGGPKGEEGKRGRGGQFFPAFGAIKKLLCNAQKNFI